MFEIFKAFRFEAAHALADPAHSAGRYTRLHGHSYRAEIFIRGLADDAGWVVDLGALEAMLQPVRNALDHQFLNDVPDLGPATLEHLAAFIWRNLAPDLPGLHKIIVHRDSCGEGCIYRGPAAAARMPAQVQRADA